MEVFMDCHIRALKALGGVPVEIFYDNMKSVVVGREYGRPVFNTEFLHFARHCGFAPRACLTGRDPPKSVIGRGDTVIVGSRLG